VVNGHSTISGAPQPASVRAEAAAWVARLQGPERTPATERAFRRWMEADPAHAAAFNRATEVWEGIGGAAAGMLVGRGLVARGRVLASVCAIAFVVAGGAWGVLRDPVYSTGVGEQRNVRLEDGSRLALNTNTKVVVRYSEGRRDLELVRGEAQFDVARNPARPFIVTAEGQQVRALGTSFVVRDDGASVAVILLEGKVRVSPARRPLSPSARPVDLAPGERAMLAAEAPARIDRPSLEAVTAWRSGEILLDDTPLTRAVAEMNRYNKKQIEIEDPEVAGLRVTGIFRSGESQSFARTVAAQYGLAVVEQSDRILLVQALPG
jgi:transmembrane sensor